MDLRSMWTATFPQDPTLALSGPIEDDFGMPGSESLSDPSPSDGQNVDTPAHLSGGESSQGDANEVVRVRNKPMPRKGHKKSRRGCFGCKRRKIKCPETKPSCCNCEKAGILCEYPKLPENQIALRSPIPPPQATPTIFSMNDMRFFHHFIVKAYPHLPVGADQTWTLEMPAIAHQYDYLLHAMLALGASHLTLTTSDDLRSQALSHRVEAMTSLNKALSRPAMSKEEGDARFAAFMVLTFESSCMPEGFYDFLTMLRGCILNGDLQPGSLFANFAQDRHLETMNERFSGVEFPTLDTRTLGEAISSLAALEPFCESDVQKKHHRILTQCAVNGYSSPGKAYQSFVRFYNTIGEISHTEFQSLIDRQNYISQLLLSHFLATHVLLRHISVYEMGARSDVDAMYQVMLNWVTNIDTALPESYKQYNAWPRSFIGECAPHIVAGRHAAVKTNYLSSSRTIMEI